MKKFLSAIFCLTMLALNAFGAGLTVTSPIKAGSIELKPGEYKFEVKNEKVVFKEGRNVIAEVPATTETAAKKYANTTYESANGQITAIRVGGTNTRIVLK